MTLKTGPSNQDSFLASIKYFFNNRFMDLKRLTFIMAIYRGWDSIVELFLLNGMEVNFNINEWMPGIRLVLKEEQLLAGSHPLHIAAFQGHAYIANLLIREGAELEATTTQNYTALWIATRYEHLNIVELLIEKKAKVDNSCKKTGALYCAASLGNQPIVNALLEAGARPTCETLLTAVKKGHIKIVKSLIKRNAPFDPGQLLCTTASYGHLDILTFLHEKKLDIDSTNSEGDTALHMAAQNGHLPIVEFLIQKNAKVDALNHSQQAPVLLALAQNHKTIVCTLLRSQAQQLSKTICIQGRLSSNQALEKTTQQLKDLKLNGPSKKCALI